MFSTFLSYLSDLLYPLIDAVSQIFALAFYIFVAGIGIYGMASVVYNIVLAHQRRREERQEPPTARVAGTVYPDGEGVNKK